MQLTKNKIKKFSLPLFWKFSIAIITIVIIFGTINSVLIYHNVQSALKTESEKRGLFIAKSLARQIVPSFLFEDHVAMQNIIDNIKSTDPSISYIFVLEENNDVIVNTFENYLPPELGTANYVPDNSESSSQRILLKGKSETFVLDIAVPIISSRIGTLRLGIKQNALEHDVQTIVNVFWIMVLLFLIVGIIGAIVFAKFITDPIKSIQNTADNFDLTQIGKKEIQKIRVRENFLNKFRILFRAEDEIDILANRFNEMIHRLETTYIELQKTQSHLLQAEKLATVGTLTAGLAHEINSPIAGIQNCLRRIKESPNKIEQNSKYLDMIDNAVNKIEKVVSNLLNFSRKHYTDFKQVSLNDVIENSLLLVAHRLEKQRIAISKNINSKLTLIMGNKNELEQVFVNLLINSIDAIEENNLTNDKCEKRITIDANEDESEIIITVTDTGIGVSEENITHVFDPFFTTKPVGKGTGLGMSIVYNIIKAHNGRITIASEAREKTSVTLYFPKK